MKSPPRERAPAPEGTDAQGIRTLPQPAFTDSDASRGSTYSNFAKDKRLQALSFQARDLLRSIFECFPEILVENGRAPADCARLRCTCYAHRTDVLDSHIGRWLKELEQHSVVILWQTSDQSRWLCLARAPALSHSNRPGESYPSNVQSIESELPKAGGDSVIHNPAGLSPPFDLNKLAAAAATSTDPSDFCTRARALCPGLDLCVEWNDYVEHRRKLNRPATLEIFVQRWLPRAQRRFGKITRQKRPFVVAYHPEPSPQMDLFEERERQQFLQQYRERQQRKISKSAEGG
jgi:hypothetical protein